MSDSAILDPSAPSRASAAVQPVARVASDCACVVASW